MAFNLDSWASAVNGKYIDLDGAFGAQCHDLWLHYLYALGGKPGEGHAPRNGYTHYVWVDFPHHRPGLARLFTKHDSKHIKRGDVVFWDKYPGSAIGTHVAIALADARNGSVLCMTQNPGHTRREYLPIAGTVGVLRPKIFQKTAATAKHAPKPKAADKADTTKTSQGDEMKNIGIYYTEGKTTIYALLNPVSGFWSEYSNGQGNGPLGGSYNNPIAAAFNTGNYAKVTKAHFNALKRDVAAVRTRK